VDAADQAIATFGSARRIAAEWNAAHRSVRGQLLRYADALAIVAGVGLTAIGVSGLVTASLVGRWGLSRMWGDPVGTSYPAAACRHWMGIWPAAGSCTRAYLLESNADGLLGRYAAGVLGVLLLVVLVIINRRYLANLGNLVTAIAVPVFGLAALALAALAYGAHTVALGAGAGQYSIPAVICALLTLGIAAAWLVHARPQTFRHTAV
jgi:hypothetical protein